MNLRTRFFVLLCGFVVVLGLISAAVAHLVFTRYAEQIDQENLQTVVGRAVFLSDRMCSQIAGLAEDWGLWDDTYQFMMHSNAEYVAANIVPETFQSLNVDVISFWGPDGQFRAGWQFDASTRDGIQIPDSCWLKAFQNHSRRSEWLRQRKGAGGFVNLPCGIWLIGIVPILTSQTEGPAMGVCVMGRKLDESRMEDMRMLVHPSARLLEHRAEGRMLAEELSSRSDMLVDYIHLAGIEGFPLVDMALAVPRVALAQSYINAFYLPGWILISGGALTLFMLILLEQTVIKPMRTSIGNIRSGMETIVGSRDETALRTVARRRDEMGHLAGSILDVLSKLDDSRRQVARTEALYRTLIGFLPQAAVCIDSDERILVANKRFVEWVGKPTEELVGKRLGDAWPVALVEEIQKKTAGAHAEGTLFVPEMETLIDGKTRWMEVMITRIPLQESAGPICLVQFTDITERVRADREEEERRAETERVQRLAALGTLVSGVAHEVNNPNSVISLNMNVLLRQVTKAKWQSADEQQGVLALITETLDASHRIASLVGSLKHIARPARAARGESSDVNAVLRKSVGWLRAEIARKKIEVVWKLADDLPAAFISEQALSQVFVNVAQNACHAVEPRGVIRISSWYDGKSDVVNVCIEDNGCGIAPQNMPHIFDPFFTTRRQDGGMGLGLFISASLLESNNSAIKVDSTEGQGTRVTVSLPRSNESEKIHE